MPKIALSRVEVALVYHPESSIAYEASFFRRLFLVEIMLIADGLSECPGIRVWVGSLLSVHAVRLSCLGQF